MSLENKFDQAKSAVKEGVGKVTGDNKTEADEDAKEAVEGAVEGIKNSLDK